MSRKMVIIIFFLLICGFGLHFFNALPVNDQQLNRTITVGWIGPLTGPANTLGIDNLNAVKLALIEYQSKKSKSDPDISLVVFDDSYNVEKSKEAYAKLVAESHAKVVMISTYSGVIALADQALEDSVLLIDPIDNDKQLASINKNILLIAKETENLAGVLANALIDHDKKKIAIFYYNDDEFMPNLAVALREILEKSKISVDLYPHRQNEKDFSASLNHAKEEGSDALVFFGYTEIGNAMNQAHELGISIPFYASNSINQLTTNSKLKEVVYIPDFTLRDGNQVKATEFMQAYLNSYGVLPLVTWTADQAYDAATLLFKAIQQVSHKKGDFTDNLRNELLGTTNFEGVSGNITILPTGASRGIYFSLYKLKDGKITPVVK